MYSTKSLSLASFLYSNKDVEFKGVDKTDPQNQLFQFEPEKIVEKIVDSYYTVTGDNCNAKKLLEGQKSLKDLLFESKRQSGY
jgi:hypothetical protein